MTGSCAKPPKAREFRWRRRVHRASQIKHLAISPESKAWTFADAERLGDLRQRNCRIGPPVSGPKTSTAMARSLKIGHRAPSRGLGGLVPRQRHRAGRPGAVRQVLFSPRAAPGSNLGIQRLAGENGRPNHGEVPRIRAALSRSGVFAPR